jgi:DNA-directed RNA polymerase subunit F
MIGKKINSVQEIPFFEVKELMKERSAEGDMNYEQGLAYDYIKKFSKVSKVKGEKMLAELREVEGMSDSLAISIINLLPSDIDVLRLILPKDSPFSEEQLKKIIEVSVKYSKK